VVTKAMGAFLVLMLVFMQYYSSRPLGQKTVADIVQSIDDTQKDLSEAIKKVAENADPKDVTKILEEALRRLAEARQLIEQLRRENDALNAQVQRLESENTQLAKQMEDLQRKIDAQKIIISGDLINWDCLDVRLQIALVTPTMYIEREKGQKDPYVLNFGGSLGSSDATDDTDILRSNPKAAADAPGDNFRISNSAFRYASDPGTYSLIVTKQRPQVQKIRGYNGRPLNRSKQDCTILLSLQATTPAKEQLLSQFTRKIILPKDDYATALYEIKLGGSNVLDLENTSPAMQSWLADQIAHAEKGP